MPKNPNIKKVLVIGSGPIVIGQAAEFDYAGTQACRSLKEEGMEVVLINSNPATIMTDKDIADKVYIEPGFEGLLDIGTDAGGCIEVFANENDAKNRDTYLAGFDGGILSSGGHYIIGTVLIRTSNALTGTQQLELTDAIKEALLKVIH